MAIFYKVFFSLEMVMEKKLNEVARNDKHKSDEKNTLYILFVSMQKGGNLCRIFLENIVFLG